MQIPLVKRLLPPGKRVGALVGGEELVTRHDNIGTVVHECTNMVPSTRALNKRLGLPVYNIYAFVNWLHAGLNPRGFNLPGDQL
jgi:hypothetical protein